MGTKQSESPPTILAVTGASGAIYALRTASALLRAGRAIELIVSSVGRTVLAEELGIDDARTFSGVISKSAGLTHGSGRIVEYGPDEMAAPPASGSHPVSGMVIVPCSMKTLSAVAAGSSRNLIERAADVTLKERRPLVLVPRETPLSLVHLRNMTAAAEAGAVIVPAAPAFYQKPESFEDLADFVAGRILSLLGVEQRLFEPWDGAG
jgi:4-hydroxy-3-polyprenylbenzoate decarboxylase